MTLQMGIIKIEVKMPELVQALEMFKENRVAALESLTTDIREGVSGFFNSLLQTEMEIFLGRPDQKLNKRNGYQVREYALKGVGCVRVRHPVDRKREFKSSVLPPREQIDPRVREDIAVLHLAGISNRVMAMISKRILGVEVSTDTVTKSLDVIEDKALSWLERSLEGKYWALFIDGTNFKIQRRGSTDKEPSLVVLGIDSNNRMSVLSIQPGNKDNAESWRQVFKDLIARGLDSQAVQIGIMDGLPGLEKAFKESLQKLQPEGAGSIQCEMRWQKLLKDFVLRSKFLPIRSCMPQVKQMPDKPLQRLKQRWKEMLREPFGSSKKISSLSLRTSNLIESSGEHCVQQIPLRE